MQTIREAIQRVLSLASRGVQSSDFRLTRRHVYSKLKTVRERLIVQEYKKNQKISQWSYQTINCLEMIQIPLIECPCVPPLGMYILRSKFPIPDIMTGADAHIIQGVTSVDYETKYDETQWHTKKYKKGNKYTSTNTDFFIKDSYIYLTSPRKPERITFSALGADPVEWYNFSTCCEENPCINILDMPFPMEGDLFEAAVELASMELVQTFVKGAIEDKTSNTSDDATGQA